MGFVRRLKYVNVYMVLGSWLALSMQYVSLSLLRLLEVASGLESECEQLEGTSESSSLILLLYKWRNWGPESL